MTLEASVNWDFIYHIFKINKFKLLKCFYKILRKILKNPQPDFNPQPVDYKIMVYLIRLCF